MRGHGGVDGTGRALDPPDGLLGALADAGAAAVALGIVDDSDVVLQEDRLVRAVAHAEAAGNAADLAGLVDQRALVLVGALDRGLRGNGLHLDDVARAGHGAGRAAGALFAVHDGHAVDDVDGVKLARAGAVAQTQAAIGAGAGAARNGGRSSAGLDALVVKPLAAVLAARTDDGGAQAGAVVGGIAHDGVDGVGSLVAARGTLEGGGTVLHDGLGVVGTAGVAAAAAVGAGQTFRDLRDARVLIHSHELGGQHKDHAAGQAQHHHDNDSKYDRVHSLHSPFLEYRVDDVFDQTAKAHEAHGGDSGRNQRDGQALEALRRVGGLDAGTHAAEQQHGDQEADARTGGADKRLGVGQAEAELGHNGGVVLHGQNGDAQHAAVGRDQRQVDAQGLIQRRDVLFQRDLDQLDQNGDDEDEDDRLQVTQIIGIQQEDLQREGHSRGNDHDDDNSSAHAHGGIQLFGNAEERADTQKLHQYVVVDQDHAEEDGGKRCDLRTHCAAPSFCSSLAASIFSSMTSPQLLRSMGLFSLRSSQTQPAIRQPKTKKPPGAEFMTVMRSTLSGMMVMPSQVPLPMISRKEDMSSMVRM